MHMIFRSFFWLRGCCTVKGFVPLSFLHTWANNSCVSTYHKHHSNSFSQAHRVRDSFATFVLAAEPESRDHRGLFFLVLSWGSHTTSAFGANVRVGHERKMFVRKMDEQPKLAYAPLVLGCYSSILCERDVWRYVS